MRASEVSLRALVLLSSCGVFLSLPSGCGSGSGSDSQGSNPTNSGSNDAGNTTSNPPGNDSGSRLLPDAAQADGTASSGDASSASSGDASGGSAGDASSGSSGDASSGSADASSGSKGDASSHVPDASLPVDSGTPTSTNAPFNLVMTGQSENSVSLSWSAPTAITVGHYKIYRNGAAYATSTSTTYTDTDATNTNSPMTPAGPTLAIPNTIYSYAVSAVDTSGHEGPLQSDATFWAYYNGVWNWEGDYSYPGGQIHIDYADTTGAPEEGPADIKVTCDTAASGFLPFSGKTTTQWDMEGGSFHYIQLDLKPTLPGQDWELFVVSRLPVIGDNTPWALLNSLSGYGPVPAVVGAWNHYKIPLSAFDMGFSHMTASISGSNLIVTSVESGGGLVGVGSGGYVTGPGVPTGTTITGNGPSNGGPGTYPIQGPGISSTTSVPSTAMVEQHTAIYKFGLVDRNSSVPSSNVYFIDNVKFTVD